MSAPSVSPVDFDPTALGDYLCDQFGEGELSLERISGGQSNPTYFVTFGPERMVLRKQPAGPILRGAHAVDREFRVLTALSGTGVPVPRPLIYCDDASVIGTPFYLMERLDGRVFHDCALPGLRPAERRGLYFGMADALARLHSVNPDHVGLSDFGRPGNYFERQLSRWTKQWRESQFGPLPALDAVAAWLADNLPPDDGRVSIAHGDFRLGNLLFHPTRPEVIGILDWELATLGHPLADVGFCCMPWHSAPNEYGGILGLDREALGIPAKEEFLRRYESGAPPIAPLRPFHIAFALFRFSVIFVGIADRVRAGTAASADAKRLAPLAERFAVRACEAAGI